MISLARTALAATAVAATVAAGPAHSAQLCGWLVETAEAHSLHNFAFWLEADDDVAALYKMTGKGVVTEGGTSYSPGSGSFSLRPKRPQSYWSFGTTLGEGDVDIVGEIHVAPKSVFSEEETPTLASFVFRRHVPGNEKTPPTDFAKRQCVTVPASH